MTQHLESDCYVYAYIICTLYVGSRPGFAVINL